MMRSLLLAACVSLLAACAGAPPEPDGFSSLISNAKFLG